MKPFVTLDMFFKHLSALPQQWLSSSRGYRFGLTAVSYVLGITGLLAFFPLAHNGAAMFLPLACASWLFRYRGLLLSLVLNGLVFQSAYLLFWGGLLPAAAYVEGAEIGFLTSLLIGLMICWLRVAVDEVSIARERVRASEHARLLTELEAKQVSMAYEQERKLNTLKEQFLLHVSHELRTPLTALAGFLDLLAAYHEDMDLPRRAYMIKEAQASQEELVALVEQILEGARTTTGHPSVKPEVVTLRPLIQQVLAMLEPVGLADYSVCLQVSEQACVWADPQLLRQVLRNVLSNICKYVPPHTEIRIEVVHPQPLSPLCLSIQDAGPGIPADELPLLFEKFTRLRRDLTGSVRGMGLGLYLCKQMVEAMDGQIWLESSGKPGEGSRFSLSLPTLPSQTHRPEEHEAASGSSGKETGPGEQQRDV